MDYRTYILIIFALVFGVVKMEAVNYYVSNTGNDLNSGLSLNEAFRTIQKAANLVVAGDTVRVENGVYSGFDIRDVDGTDLFPIVFIGLGDSVLINNPGPIRDDGINVENADHIVIEGFICNNMPGNGNGIRLVLADHCVVRNCICDGNAERGIFTGFTDDILIEHNICSNSIDEHGIYVSNSSDRPIIRFNECYGNNNIGIHMNGDLSLGGDGIISDPMIYGNIIHDNNLAAGINLDGVENAVIFNNLIYNNHFAQGIAMFQGDGAVVSNGAKIFNNTIIVPEDGRWGILLKEGANQNTEIFNNIILNEHPWRGCISAEDTVLLKSDYNLLNDKMSSQGDGSSVPLSQWQSLGLDINSILAGDYSLIFKDPEGNDFNLINGSPAIDAGTDAVSSIVRLDINGTSRPMGSGFDMGVYEYQPTTSDNSIISRDDVLSVYPNPVFDRLHLSGLKGCFEVSLYQAQGALVWQEGDVCFSHDLDVSWLGGGTYFITLTDRISGHTWCELFIKANP